MIDTKADFKIINKESAEKHKGEIRDKITDPVYVCNKMIRHLASLSNGQTHDTASGVHEVSKILWYTEKLIDIFDK